MVLMLILIGSSICLNCINRYKLTANFIIAACSTMLNCTFLDPTKLNYKYEVPTNNLRESCLFYRKEQSLNAICLKTTIESINQSIKIYIAPLQDTYSEALPTQAKRKGTVFRRWWN